MVKNLPATQETSVQSLGQEDPLDVARVLPITGVGGAHGDGARGRIKDCTVADSSASQARLGCESRLLKPHGWTPWRKSDMAAYMSSTLQGMDWRQRCLRILRCPRVCVC